MEEKHGGKGVTEIIKDVSINSEIANNNLTK